MGMDDKISQPVCELLVAVKHPVLIAVHERVPHHQAEHHSGDALVTPGRLTPDGLERAAGPVISGHPAARLDFLAHAHVGIDLPVQLVHDRVELGLAEPRE